MKTFFANVLSVDMLANKWITALNENILPRKKNIFAHNINLANAPSLNILNANK